MLGDAFALTLKVPEREVKEKKRGKKPLLTR